MSAPLSRTERDDLLAQAAKYERELYPSDESVAEPVGAPRLKLLDAYYKILHEYGDRLPRVAFSRCPHTGQILKRALDPFGLDGPYWHADRIVEIDEPAAPLTFTVLMGALDLHGREPSEVVAEVIPGPDIPFVVPRLLGLPGMKAVISRLKLETSDTAHVISYFSNENIPPQHLHQHWLRRDLWFPNDAGGTSWLIQNDAWDFDLERWIESGHVSWTDPDDLGMVLRDRKSGIQCPFVGLPGNQHPQSLNAGQSRRMPMPDAMAVDPFQ